MIWLDRHCACFVDEWVQFWIIWRQWPITHVSLLFYGKQYTVLWVFICCHWNVGMYPEAGIFPDSYGSSTIRTKSGYSSRLNTLRCVPTGWFQKNFLNSKCILVVTASHRLRGKYCQFPAVLPPMIYGSLMTRPIHARFHYRQILLIFYQE